MTALLTIVGWLWRDPNCRTVYTAEHVNIWARMIHRNLKLPHRFVVFTDDMHDNFDPLIEKAPLWKDWHLLDNPCWPAGLPQCYVRLKAFSDAPEIKKLLGPRYASIDLDCLVTGSLDRILAREEPFVIWRRPILDKNKTRLHYNASMWLMDTGAHPEVWSEFKGAVTLISLPGQREYFMTDQGWMLYKLGPKKPCWTLKDGVFMWSWLQTKGILPKRDANGRLVVEYGGETIHCRVIFFNGSYKPWSYRWLEEVWR